MVIGKTAAQRFEEFIYFLYWNLAEYIRCKKNIQRAREDIFAQLGMMAK